MGRYYLFVDTNYQQEFHRLWKLEMDLMKRRKRNTGEELQDTVRQLEETRATLKELRPLGQYVKTRRELGLF